jgi:hypothetical protein
MNPARVTIAPDPTNTVLTNAFQSADLPHLQTLM